MKTWVQKLIKQLDYEDGANGKAKAAPKLSDDRATLLYLIDLYSKHLIEVDTHPVRRTREELDAFARELLSAGKEESEKSLFNFRQYFSSFRTAEYTYIRKSFEDFKSIIWNFVEHLGEDFANEQKDDKEVSMNLDQLKDAVETNSIDDLREKSKQFISFYLEHQSRREQRRTKRMRGIRKNLDLMKKQLVEADRTMRVDHLTQAYNRKSFDEQIKNQISLCNLEKTTASLIILDIDHFKKINDTYGHDIGDCILKECVRLLQDAFGAEADFVARIGGEEFAVLLPNHAVPHAVKRADNAMTIIRKETFVQDTMQIKFTVSMGIAQLIEGETADQWMKRADTALYQSKHGGRDRFTVAPSPLSISKVA